MQQLLLIMAGLTAVGAYVPYTFDVLKGCARPARSTRIMFVVLMLLVAGQQVAVHSGWLLVTTVGELVGSLGILLLSLRHGEGGLHRLDKLCYLLLVLDLLLWASTGSALLALHLSVAADLVAFTPTLVKTWHNPHSETPLFYAVGVLAPALNMLAAGQTSYRVLLFPVYLVAANLFELLLIVCRGGRVSEAQQLPITDS